MYNGNWHQTLYLSEISYRLFIEKRVSTMKLICLKFYFQLFGVFCGRGQFEVIVKYSCCYDVSQVKCIRHGFLETLELKELSSNVEYCRHHSLEK